MPVRLREEVRFIGVLAVLRERKYTPGQVTKVGCARRAVAYVKEIATFRTGYHTHQSCWKGRQTRRMGYLRQVDATSLDGIKDPPASLFFVKLAVTVNLR